MRIEGEMLKRLLQTMLLIRHFEDKLTELSTVEGEFPGLALLCTGQEAVAAGACAALRSDDLIISNHRSHGHLIAKGADPNALMAEIYGKRTGYCKGKSGTLHIAVPELGAPCTTTVVGGGIPIAVGCAFSAQYRGSDQVTLCFFGDGAANEGSFHEALNLGSVWTLPVVFMCENNCYAAAQHLRDQFKIDNISARASAYGMPGISVDGNDVEAVYEAVSTSVAMARDGEGPSLIEAKTYRWRGHFEAMDHQLYQPEEEREAWRQKCPVLRLRSRLLDEGRLSEEEFAQMEARAKERVEAAVEFARQSPVPEAEEALDDVYAES